MGHNNQYNLWSKVRLMKCIVALLLLFSFVFSIYAKADTYPSYYGARGTAKFIGGRTVVISIFADDKNTSWHFPLSGNEKKQYDKINKRMKIGLKWLKKQVKNYGVDCQFIWNYENEKNTLPLALYASFSEDLTVRSKDGYLEVRNYINENIDTDEYLSHYNADNIVYAVHLNAPNSDDYRSYACPADFEEIEEYQVCYEFVVYVPYGHGRENTPALYAHELLHCFGAVDLYHPWDRLSGCV